MEMPRVRMTNAEYLALPEDGRRYELIEGELIEMPSPTAPHGAIVALLVILIGQFVRSRKLGRVFGDNQDYILNDGLILKPDVAFISIEHGADVPPYYHIAPDLAVEVLSPSNSASEMDHKRTLYLRYGSRLVWIIDPDKKTVTVYRAGQDGQIISQVYGAADTLAGGDVLPEFRLPVREIFEA